MLYRFKALAFAATLLSSTQLVSSLSASDIPAETPISSLLQSANQHLAKGETNDALTYYDVAISRDPSNYLTFFKRGATYLSLGRTVQAQEDFDKVLLIKPGFEGALLQRAKIRSKNGEWDAARKDYEAAGKNAQVSGSTELAELEEARGAASLAYDAEKAGDWDECITQAGAAIVVASKQLSLRQTRSHCRFEKGEVQEGISDLLHVLQMQPGLTEPHVKISSILYYSMGDTERALTQIRKCLHSDPDSKPCKKLYRTQKNTDKVLAKVKKSMSKRQFSSAIKPLVPSANGEDIGLIAEVKDEVKALKATGTIPVKAPDDFVANLVEMACEAYTEMASKKGPAMCEEALAYNPHSKWGMLAAAQKKLDAEQYEASVNILEEALEHHPGDQALKQRLQKAEIALKRSKEKDYYKVLGVAHDADSRQIKSAYRKLTQKHHPDKAHKNGITKEAAEKKMAEINEAYEVLSDEGLRERFDRGDDPNSHEGQQGGHHGNPFQQGFPGGGQQFFQQGGGGQQFKFQFGGGGGGFPF